MNDKQILEIANNKKAYHDYEILDKIECGLALQGTEIKSVRSRNVNLKDSYVMIRNGQAFVYQMHISPYGFGNIFNHEAQRNRKLLLHKKEILKLEMKTKQKGITLVPLKIYIKGKYAKLLVGIGKGKHTYNKKEAIKQKDLKREMQREMKNYR